MDGSSELFLGILWVLMFVVIPLAIPVTILVIGLRRRDLRYSGLLVALGSIGTIIAVLFLIFTVNFTPVDPSSEHRGELKANVHTIRIGIERYAVEHDGSYPENIQEFYDYLSWYPDNPYTRDPMVHVDFGSSDYTGNFTYLPVKENGKVIGYYFLGYGDEKEKGYDVNGDGVFDHVIIVLSSNDPITNQPDAFAELCNLLSVYQPEVQ